MPQSLWLSHRRIFLFVGYCLVLLGIGGVAGIGHHLVQAAEQQTLYERLGGYDAISRIVDEFLKKMWVDPQVGRYFVGMGTDTRNQLRQKNKLLMCKNTGGPCKIISRDLKLAHGGLGITDSDWQVAIRHLVDTLNALKIGEQEQQELLQIITGLKGSIVERRER